MARYLMRRALQGLLSLWFVATACFLLIRLTGDPVTALVPEYAPAELQRQVRADLGLDQPIYLQYAHYIWNLLHGDLGSSWATGQSVTEVLGTRIPGTGTLALAAVIVSLLFIPLGVISAVHPGSLIDGLARFLALIGQSMPPFYLSIMLILIFAVTLPVFPVAGRSGVDSYILPGIALGFTGAGGIVRLTRSSMLEVLDSEYVRAAYAKGTPHRVVIIRHAFRNALVPLTTYLGILIGTFMGGSVAIESIFAWPGVGKLSLDAVTARDFPVVQGSVILIAVGFVAASLIVDLLYTLIDPRIRTS